MNPVIDLSLVKKRMRSVLLVRLFWDWVNRIRFGTISKQVFSIGMYYGADPRELAPSEQHPNPIVSAEDVTDIDAKFVADPFLIRNGNNWDLFFEVLPSAKADPFQNGVIAVAHSFDKGLTWRYGQIVLAESFHLSYPYVFTADGNYYMVPESSESRSIRLYRAVDYPTRWELKGELLSGDFTDSTIFEADGTWWMMARYLPPGARARRDLEAATLRLFYADRVLGPWTEHPKSPVISGDSKVVRPAGRVVRTQEGTTLRFAQDGAGNYGSAVHCLEITKLTREDYEEVPFTYSPILEGSGKDWNADGMHHVDLHFDGDGWVAVVDGWRFE